MNMKMEVIIMGVNSYDMTSEGGQKGASVKVIGEHLQSQNYSGVSISSAVIDYAELGALEHIEYPAKFDANIAFVNVKNRAGKDIAGIKINQPVFKSSMMFIDKK